MYIEYMDFFCSFIFTYFVNSSHENSAKIQCRLRKQLRQPNEQYALLKTVILQEEMSVEEHGMQNLWKVCSTG